MNKELTTYQQSIIDASSQRTLKKKITKVLGSFLVFGLAAGYYSLYKETLPSFLTGWLIFATISYTIVNYIGLVIVGVMNLITRIIHWVLNTLEETYENKNRLDKIRTTTSDFSRTTNLFSIKFDYYAVVDIVADSLLFVMLVTANRPYMAVFYAVPIVLQWLLIINTKKIMLKAIQLLPDTLEEETPTDIDKLMDELCNGTEE